ncbi:histidine kinase [Aequorivita sp. H23M31]|uniref:histidine kinase n=1 Tax=Aequorivita ciconiae TaxID=2494375 RepID=A0A410G258_9FLAO|nr:histidine kinase [Aequorivita sp. H23M31]QAA81325.1 histidine kinase [Aequorivita sp. H23M31]
MLQKEEVLLIGYFITTIFLLVIFVVIFVVAFLRRKNSFLKERFESEQRYQRELAKSQIEIQEATLKNIAWELHDNVGQLLSVANMQLNVLRQAVPEVYREQIMETRDMVQKSVQEVRSLSKVLNNEVVLKNGLLSSLQVELDRFNRLGYLEASIQVVGDIVPIKNSSEIILFRILQEFFSNVIKHARASKLFVSLEYMEDSLEITVIDDGVGFDTTLVTGGSGMETMKSRAALLNASFSINSEKGKGVQLFLKYHYSNAR